MTKIESKQFSKFDIKLEMKGSKHFKPGMPYFTKVRDLLRLSHDLLLSLYISSNLHGLSHHLSLHGSSNGTR